MDGWINVWMEWSYVSTYANKYAGIYFLIFDKKDVCIYAIEVSHKLCFQGTLLELLCDVVDSSSRQGKSLVVCDFPRDLRWAEEFEAKVRKFTVICSLFFFFKERCSV